MVEKTKDDNSWFESWFDSEYYHMLYSNRDESEARSFISNLEDELNPCRNAKVLDLACGKGRHTRILSEFQLDVLGVDLSPNSIKFAKQFESDNLHFSCHDMRDLFLDSHFDYVFNFFTSFGYFDNEEDHYKAIKSMSDNLKQTGELVIDYLNSEKVAANLILQNSKEIDGVKFLLRRKHENGYFVKDVEIHDKNETRIFQEKVRSFELSDFELMLDDAGMKITRTFGNYDLTPFDLDESPRLILIAEKK